MHRRAAASIRPIEPDPVHRSRLVTQVVNKVMLDGKKSTAERIVYDALAIIGEKTGKDPIEQLGGCLKTRTPGPRGPPPRPRSGGGRAAPPRALWGARACPGPPASAARRRWPSGSPTS